MTRARLAALIVVLLAAGGTAVPFVVGDGDGSSARTSDSVPSEPRPVAAPQGSLEVGVPELAASYNPFDPRARTPAATQILALVLPQLFDVAPDGEVVPSLVEDGSVSVEGREVRFRLREGARWSDGEPITVEDLAFTLDVVRSDRWPGPRAGYREVEELGGSGRDVVLRLESSDVAWRRLFSGNDYVLPRHRLEGGDLAEEWASGPDVSGGPYSLRGFTPGLDVVLAANGEWWGDGPGIRDLRVLTVPDATTLEQLFERGELDVAWMPAFTDRVRWARRLDGADVATDGPGGRLVSVWLQTEEVPPGARHAVLGLVDRDRFVEVLLEGEAALATSWGLVEGDAGWPSWSLDRGRAEEVDSRSLVLAHAEEETMSSLLVRAVQRRARDTELSFDSVSLLAERLDGEWLPEGRFDVALADEVQWPRPCWRCRFGAEAVGRTNWPRFEADGALLERADRGDAGAASRLEERLADDAVLLPMWRPGALVVSRGVDGVVANAWSHGPFHRVEDWRLRDPG